MEPKRFRGENAFDQQHGPNVAGNFLRRLVRQHAVVLFLEASIE
jgi:hypothetical protein